MGLLIGLVGPGTYRDVQLNTNNRSILMMMNDDCTSDDHADCISDYHDDDSDDDDCRYHIMSCRLVSTFSLSIPTFLRIKYDFLDVSGRY